MGKEPPSPAHPELLFSPWHLHREIRSLLLLSRGHCFARKSFIEEDILKAPPFWRELLFFRKKGKNISDLLLFKLTTSSIKPDSIRKRNTKRVLDFQM